MAKRHEVSDEEWAILDRVIPKSKAKTGRPASDRHQQTSGQQPPAQARAGRGRIGNGGPGCRAQKA